MIDKYREAEALTGIACRLLDDFFGGRHRWQSRISVERLDMSNGYQDILGQLFGSHTAANAAFRPFLGESGDEEYSTHLAWCAFNPIGEWQGAYTYAWDKVLSSL